MVNNSIFTGNKKIAFTCLIGILLNLILGIVFYMQKNIVGVVVNNGILDVLFLLYLFQTAKSCVANICICLLLTGIVAAVTVLGFFRYSHLLADNKEYEYIDMAFLALIGLIPLMYFSEIILKNKKGKFDYIWGSSAPKKTNRQVAQCGGYGSIDCACYLV
ncbi:MAG: hypothetical protein LBU60_03500 [Clostridiales bacterium]|jgi:hypothetical protein|nr:hypothetical protein [Clostridiales bacterium]